MTSRLLLLLLAAGFGAAGGYAQKQTEVTHYKYDINMYADINGDGTMEQLEKIGRTIYDYPEGSLPGPVVGYGEGTYYLEAEPVEDYLRVADGAWYFRFRMIKMAIFNENDMLPYEEGMETWEDFKGTTFVYDGDGASMSVPYPEGREPDIKEDFNEDYMQGQYHWFRITSQEDVNAWLNINYGGYENRTYTYYNDKLWKIFAGQAPSHNEARIAWVDFNGTVKMYIDGTEEMDLFTTGAYYKCMSADYNADGIADVMLRSGSYEDGDLVIAMSGPDGYTLKNTGLKANLIFNCVVDLNRDGRPDLYGWETQSTGGTISYHHPTTYIQTADGKFVRKRLSVVTDEAEIDDATFSSGNNGTFSTSYINMSGMSGGKGMDASTGMTSEVMNTADINGDGYPVLIQGQGQSFLSLPDGRYYSAVFNGNVTTSDLNGDGISDMIIFDSKNKQVVLHLSNGAGFDMQQLIENGNISAMFCRDLDGDGLIDILLTINTPRNENYAYLAFFKNNGDGTFRRTVRTLEGEHEFSKPFDLNNNGRPTIISHLKSPNYGYKRIDWDESFKLTQTDLFPRPEDTPIYKNGPLMEFADYDGDGQLEIIADLRNELGNSQTYLYTPAMVNANTAPQRMAAPGVIADRSNGTVKIEWQAGTDSETKPVDMAYDVKVSTADGGNVLMRECKVTQLIANSGSWPMGTLNVSVRAKDTGGRLGEWSEASPFVNEAANALFTMDKAAMTTTETLTVRTVDGSEATFRAMPDGTVTALADGYATITFATAGRKTITATAPGGGSTMARISVDPLKSEQIYKSLGESFSKGFDFNQSGTIEGVGSNSKLYTYEDGKYSYYPAFSLSDTYINPITFADRNMDGQPDIFGTHLKNGTTYPWLVNDGELEFSTPQVNYTDLNGNPWNFHYVEHTADFNNDGLLDYIYESKIYRGTAEGGVEYVPFPEIDGWQPNGISHVADFNRDGRIDILMRYYNPSNPKGERFSTYILRNEGGMTFTPMVVFDRKEVSAAMIADVDNDGCPDLVMQDDELFKAYCGGKDMTEWKSMQLPGLPIITDLDNDGLCDYTTDNINDFQGGDSLLLSSMNGVKMATGDSEAWYGFNIKNEAPDFNHDGRPDPGSLILSRFENTAPTAPAEVFANTVGRYVTVSWNGATDNETPIDRLRYNVSIKKKGAHGAGSYVISPLNATDSKAVTAPALYPHYRYGTQMEIPIDRFEAGTTYEVCVQTIDPWHAHSPFSKVFEFTPQATALIGMAQRGGVGMQMPIQIYDNSGAEPVIDADGGTVNGRIITWNTPGLKTVKVTAGAAQAEHRILIVDRPMLRITLPERILTGEPISVAMPEALTANEGAKARVWGDDGMEVVYDAQSNTATVTPRGNGGHTLYISYTDDVFTSAIQEYAETYATGAGFRPELTMVGVDAATGKNRIDWNAGMKLPDATIFNGTVAIYRETTVAGDFEKIAERSIADGSYVDEDSRPDVQSNRYMISLPTAYGTESAPSAIHGSIHLMVNRGMGNAINLHWTPYEGAVISQYTILSGTSPEALQPLTTLSGNARSFTHKRESDRTTYYSIAYTLQAPVQQAAAAGKAMAPRSNEGASNVISSDDAYSVTLVESIIIGTRENSFVIGQEQPQLHLTAMVMPVLATIGNVEWSIEQGDNLATIAPDGTLSIRANTTGGIVTLQARAIDGSDVTATIDITAGTYTDGISSTSAATGKATVRPGYREVTVDPNGTTADITIYSIGGGIVHRSVARSAVSIALYPGFYIVKAGTTVQKIGIK